MDIHGARSVAIPISGPDFLIRRRRSSSRSNSHSSPDSTSTSIRKPMSIPGRHFEDAPPPLPPPRFIQDLEDGHDIVQEREQRQNKNSDLPPIKEGSSLLGGFSKRSKHQEYGRHAINCEEDNSSSHTRRGLTATIPPPTSTTTMSSAAVCSLPSVVRRPTSPSTANSM
jgi:hypothetical protein